MAPEASQAVPAVETTSTDESERDAGRSRRDLLRVLGAAAAGAVAGGALSSREARAHGTFHQDSDDVTPAIHGHNTDDGPGVFGDSDGGSGVLGVSVSSSGVRAHTFDGPGVSASSTNSDGVFAESVGGIGVVGNSATNIGVEGRSNSGVGVDGRSNSSRGVQGISNSEIGVRGESESAYGVWGQSTHGTGILAFGVLGDALSVVGIARFSTAGSGVIPASQDSVFVSNALVTAQSHVTATLTGSPGSFNAGMPVLVWVERQPGTGFVVHMSRRVGPATPFTYLIVEPG